jgi:spoIIIJ-associated protein
MENSSQRIVERIKEFLDKMGFSPVEVFERSEEGRMVYNIRTRDAQLLIGKQGATLEALQHIIRILCKEDSENPGQFFALDVDDYRDKRVIYLKELARKAAHHVRDRKKPVSLSPMPPYERKVVHNYLSLFSDIKSESVGKDPNRKIVIRHRPMKSAKDDFNFIENT